VLYTLWTSYGLCLPLIALNARGSQAHKGRAAYSCACNWLVT